MRSLLLRLSLGLHKQDILEKERNNIDEWLEKGIVVQEENKFRFHSKYRAGTVSNIQEGSAYLQAIGLYARDLLIEAENLNEAKEGDLVIAMRLMGRRGTPQAKVVVIAGRALSYSVAYVTTRDGHLSLLDIRTEHPVGIALTPEELASYREGDCLQIDNQNSVITKLLGNLDDPKVDEHIVLAQYNKHDEFTEEVLSLAQSFKSVDINDYRDRKDLRHLPFCTIDPVTAKDYDDAIYFDVEKSILYVAIADVS
ncbi:MAG: RNB domain-containing ribonuclease, partial [Campylobacterota bacterium]|nr:RNB domain-containing ribonuclease [Campylobacterota bacterium]